MKHLKRFNESHHDKIQEVQKFCESYLAYLIDKGFKVEVVPFVSYSLAINGTIRPSPNFEKIVFTYDNEWFSWDLQDNIFGIHSIVDDFIPFLQMLKEKYYFEYLLVTDRYYKIHRVKIVDDNKLDLEKLENLTKIIRDASPRMGIKDVKEFDIIQKIEIIVQA